jgi:hypothetical protein
MADEPEKMSINVYTNQKDPILKAENSSNEYILRMNEEYNNINAELRFKVQELRNIIDDLENDNDKQDSSIRYMRGMIKNYIELVKLHKSIISKRKDLTKVDNKELKLFDNYCDDIQNVMTCSFFLYMFNSTILLYLDILSVMSIWQISLNICICVFSSVHFYNMSKYYNLFGKDYKIVQNIVGSIEEQVVQVKEIESSSDFLSEYIDNL